MARREVATGGPGFEVLLRAPAGEDETDVTVVIGAEQLEPLEAGCVLDLPGPSREPALERGTVIALILTMLTHRSYGARGYNRHVKSWPWSVRSNSLIQCGVV
jgi:hypothetical protein